jgi:mRNA interferase RelE/StbE
LIVNHEPRRKLHLLPKRVRKEIGYKLYLIQEDLAGDIKKLKGSINIYRLRVGDYRVLFELEGTVITVYDVLHRKDAYR